jgi:mono/diheme cytochrome c family protein
MGAEHNDPGSRGRSPRRGRWLLGSALAACLVAVFIALALSPRGARRGLAACAGGSVPQVMRVPPSQISALRESVARVLPQRVGRLYEEGTVTAASAWSDEHPSPPEVSPTAHRPAGYEMRWWAPNGDDIVADVLVFASPRLADRYLARASGAGCHRAGAQQASPSPPLARNLSWVNPEGAPQADVWLARGARVYRLADAPAHLRAGAGTAELLTRTFFTIDTLACLLPDARCSAVKRDVIPA